MNEDLNFYYRACCFSVKHFSWIVGDLDKYKKKSEKTVSKEFLDAMDFSGFEMEPWETHILSYACSLFLFILLISLDIIIFSVSIYERNSIVFILFFTIFVPIAAMIYLSNLAETILTNYVT